MGKFILGVAVGVTGLLAAVDILYTIVGDDETYDEAVLITTPKCTHGLLNKLRNATESARTKYGTVNCIVEYNESK